MKRPLRPKLKQLSKVLIICEGKVTEPSYFNGSRVERRIAKERVNIYVAAGVPKSCALKAIEIKNENERRNKQDGILVEDAVWVVFDKDDHPEILQAMQMSSSKNIKVAFSNPCFELFLLLHFEEVSREEHRDSIRLLLKTHIPNYDKLVNYKVLGLHEKYPIARQRCETIGGRSTITSGLQSPPYCDVYKLVDVLRSM